MMVGERVETPDGTGLVVDVEHYSRIGGGIDRWGVRLDVKRYDYDVAYYWPNELRPAPAPGGQHPEERGP